MGLQNGGTGGDTWENVITSWVSGWEQARLGYRQKKSKKRTMPSSSGPVRERPAGGQFPVSDIAWDYRLEGTITASYQGKAESQNRKESRGRTESNRESKVLANWSFSVAIGTKRPYRGKWRYTQWQKLKLWVSPTRVTDKSRNYGVNHQKTGYPNGRDPS